MNKTQRIKLNTGTTTTDKYIKVQLEQDVDTIEYMSMSIYTKDAYMDFNADYGVLIGRVLANGGVGIPNAKISIFIPLDDVDVKDGNIASIYPYKTPRDKNAQGKRYNLLPRVTSFQQNTGLLKPKQPFGSFPIKPEIVTNPGFLTVYKKYYKYSTVTNSSGDYMIFGVPIGTQTVHMSIDITDISRYSMSPISMIKAGYPANLFTDDGKSIKESDDLNDLPNIETQEIGVDIIPFWGDATNFIIGITRQDFRVRAVIESTFTIFGTSMTMGIQTTMGDSSISQTNRGFYYLSSRSEALGGNDNLNNVDIRTYRPSTMIIKVFSYNETIPITSITGRTVNPANPTTIRELSASEYFEYNVGGDFVLTIPCNRKKVITNESGQNIVVPDSSTNGIFTEFYGMLLIEYDNLPVDLGYADFNGGHHTHIARGKLKIPQSYGLQRQSPYNEINNNSWRQEYQKFEYGEIYSVAQFLPTKNVGSNTINIEPEDNLANRFFPTDSGAWASTVGVLFKVAGVNNISRNQIVYDTNNYLKNPITGGTAVSTYRYDFQPNAYINTSEEFFGAQWLNFCLIFPQYIWTYDAGNNRSYDYAGIFHYNYNDDEYFVTDNNQVLFAGLTNSKNYMRGNSFRTKFVKVPKDQLFLLNSLEYNLNGVIKKIKGINIRKLNNDKLDGLSNIHSGIVLDTTPYAYQTPTTTNVVGGDYVSTAWDSNYPYSDITMPVKIGNKPTAYIFKGMYNNDCVKLLFDLNIL